MKIVGMPPARTDEGRALKAVAAAHQVVYITGSPEVSADDGNGPWAAWQVLSELVGGRFAMPGD